MNKTAIWHHRYPTHLTLKGWVYETVEAEVRILAEAEGYAMVRPKGGSPIVVRLKRGKYSCDWLEARP